MSYEKTMTMFNGTAQLIIALAEDEDLVYPGDRPFRNKSGGVDSMSFIKWIDWMKLHYGRGFHIDNTKGSGCTGYYEVHNDLIQEIQRDNQNYLKDNPIDKHGVKSGFQTFVMYCLRPKHIKTRYIKWSPGIGQMDNSAFTQDFITLTGAPDPIPTDGISIPTTGYKPISPEVTNSTESRILTLIDAFVDYYQGDKAMALDELRGFLKPGDV